MGAVQPRCMRGRLATRSHLRAPLAPPRTLHRVPARSSRLDAVQARSARPLEAACANPPPMRSCHRRKRRGWPAQTQTLGNRQSGIFVKLTSMLDAGSSRGTANTCKRYARQAPSQPRKNQRRASSPRRRASGPIPAPAAGGLRSSLPLRSGPRRPFFTAQQHAARNPIARRTARSPLRYRLASSAPHPVPSRPTRHALRSSALSLHSSLGLAPRSGRVARHASRCRAQAR